jgi:septal ring factor EnvC (AmiA/AmiB activator)
MTDPNADTAGLTDSEKLDRILARLAALDARSDDRARETRPILDQLIKEMTQTRDILIERIDAVEKEMAEVRKDLRRMDRTFSMFAVDHTRMRADIRDFDERLTDLESRPN